MKGNLISIDLAKHVFQVCVFGAGRRILSNKKLTRGQLLDYLRQYEPTTVVMEACYSAHPWGREIEALGHQVKLIPPWQVKPFVVGNKNDANDAVAIGETAARPRATFVRVKTLRQQDLQSLQRIRERLIRHRTATSNQIRGLMAEYGVILPKGIATIRKAIPALLEDGENGLTSVARGFIQRLYTELCYQDQQISALEEEQQQLLRDDEDYQRLQTIPGIGPIIAATVIASVGDARHFKNGRQMAAWMGLTPKQHASGERSRLQGISKRGNRTLRTLFIHGARTVINWCRNKTDPLSRWLQELLNRAHPCKVIVALANKLARIAWAVLANQQPYVAA